MEKKLIFRYYFKLTNIMRNLKINIFYFFYYIYIYTNLHLEKKLTSSLDAGLGVILGSNSSSLLQNIFQFKLTIVIYTHSLYSLIFTHICYN